jgi:hypothetical protein
VGTATPDPNRSSAHLLDHLIGGRQQRFRDGKAERLGGLEIDGERELGRPDDRQIGRFLPFENAPGIDANLVELIAEAVLGVAG